MGEKCYGCSSRNVSTHSIHVDGWAPLTEANLGQSKTAEGRRVYIGWSTDQTAAVKSQTSSPLPFPIRLNLAAWVHITAIKPRG